MNMFAIWCDSDMYAILAKHETAAYLLDNFIDEDYDQQHTWSMSPIKIVINPETE